MDKLGGEILINSTFNNKKTSDKIIWELSKMEQYADSDYLIVMQKFSKFLRLKVWNEITENRLCKLLCVMNTFFDLFHNNIPIPNYELIIQYIELFKQSWLKCYPFNPTQDQWNDFKLSIDNLLTNIIIKKQWDRINPYIENRNANIFDKDLIKIFDDMFKNCVAPNENTFTRDYKSIKYMYRGIRGEHDYTWLLPKPEFSTLNRWNPKGRCFAYASLEESESIFDIENNISHGEMVCLQELRIKKGEKITLGKLEFSPNIKNKKVFDFSYNDTSFSQIENQVQNEQQLLTNEIVNSIQNLINSNQLKNSKNIKKIINNEVYKKQKDTILMAERYTGKMFLKMICDNIYVPLDNDEDADPKKKEICYGAFHVMANYFEKRGYAGIIYPSTRSALIKELGKNIVIFDYQDVTYKINSLKTIQYN